MTQTLTPRDLISIFNKKDTITSLLIISVDSNKDNISVNQKSVFKNIKDTTLEKYTSYKLNGVWEGDSEKSYLILNIPLAEAIKYSTSLKQDAFIFALPEFEKTAAVHESVFNFKLYSTDFFGEKNAIGKYVITDKTLAGYEPVAESNHLFFSDASHISEENMALRKALSFDIYHTSLSSNKNIQFFIDLDKKVPEEVLKMYEVEYDWFLSEYVGKIDTTKASDNLNNIIKDIDKTLSE